MLQRAGHANIDDDDSRAHDARQRVDGRAATQEVQDHLRRDLSRVGADSFGCDAMIARHNHNRFVRRYGLLLAGDTRDLDRQRFEASETACRLGQLFLACARRRHSISIKWSDGRNGSGDIRAKRCLHVLQPFVYYSMYREVSRVRDFCLNLVRWHSAC